jgi:hypothetical protein
MNKGGTIPGFGIISHQPKETGFLQIQDWNAAFL